MARWHSLGLIVALLSISVGAMQAFRWPSHQAILYCSLNIMPALLICAQQTLASQKSQHAYLAYLRTATAFVSCSILLRMIEAYWRPIGRVGSTGSSAGYDAPACPVCLALRYVRG